MSNKAEYRKLLSELGIDDDRAEKALIDMFCEKDAEIRLARDSVSDREWALQNRLMEMEAKNVTA